MRTNLNRKLYREVFNVIAQSDIVIEVLDSRFPHLTRSKKVEKLAMREGKRLILCMNKSDLVPLRILNKWKNKLSKSHPTIFFSAQHRLGTSLLRKTIFRYGTKNQDVHCCLIGIPNTGKSTISNILRGKKAAPTSSIPGYTKRNQMIRIAPNYLFFDTPGIVPADEFDFDIQIILGTIPVEKLPDPLHAFQIILKRMKSYYLKGFLQHYNLTEYPEDLDRFIEKFALRRGRLLKGGIPDTESITRTLLQDFYDGKYQYFETPSKAKRLDGLEA